VDLPTRKPGRNHPHKTTPEPTSPQHRGEPPYSGFSSQQVDLTTPATKHPDHKQVESKPPKTDPPSPNSPKRSHPRHKTAQPPTRWILHKPGIPRNLTQGIIQQPHRPRQTRPHQKPPHHQHTDHNRNRRDSPPEKGNETPDPVEIADPGTTPTNTGNPTPGHNQWVYQDQTESKGTTPNQQGIPKRDSKWIISGSPTPQGYSPSRTVDYLDPNPPDQWISRSHTAPTDKAQWIHPRQWNQWIKTRWDYNKPAKAPPKT